MPKFSAKRILPLAIGITLPILALAGCPFGAQPTASPTPTPVPAATTRPTMVITKIDIAGTTQAERKVTVKNLGTAGADLKTYGLMYDYEDGGAAKTLMLRFGDSTVGSGQEYTFSAGKGCTDKKCVSAVLGSDSDMGLQATHGGLGIYKGVTDLAGFTAANMVDYVQYGTAKNYAQVGFATTQKVWDSATAYAPAPGGVGKSISVKTAGLTGSANWQ